MDPSRCDFVRVLSTEDTCLQCAEPYAWVDQRVCVVCMTAVCPDCIARGESHAETLCRVCYHSEEETTRRLSRSKVARALRSSRRRGEGLRARSVAVVEALRAEAWAGMLTLLTLGARVSDASSRAHDSSARVLRGTRATWSRFRDLIQALAVLGWAVATVLTEQLRVSRVVWRARAREQAATGRAWALERARALGEDLHASCTAMRQRVRVLRALLLERARRASLRVRDQLTGATLAVVILVGTSRAEGRRD